MKYTGMPAAMWLLFAKSFRQQLVENYHMNEDTAKEVTAKAKLKYKQIIQGLPEFEKNDRFKANAVSCAMLGAFVLNMPERRLPSADSQPQFFLPPRRFLFQAHERPLPLPSPVRK